MIDLRSVAVRGSSWAASSLVRGANAHGIGHHTNAGEGGGKSQEQCKDAKEQAM